MHTTKICFFALAASLAAAACGSSATSRNQAAGGVDNVGGSDTGGDSATDTGGAAEQGSGGAEATGGNAATTSTGPTSCKKGTTNLFVSLLNKSQTDVDSKIKTAVNRFFGIGTGESATPDAANGYRCYYELSSDATMGYIWAADSNDVRSEGQSYGMMMAVQVDMQTQFDHLWNFAKKYMQITSSGPLQYFFNWKGTVSGSSVSFNNSMPAPDGDQYFAAALYLADKRWGSAGTVNYKQEADKIANAFMHNAGSGNNCTIFNTAQHQVVFFPLGTSCNITDPSYHLPAFYELFALYGPTADSAAWKSQAASSRTFLASSANGTTGLHPDYATFTGSPTTSSSGDGHDQFKYDAWRVVMNMAVDFAWFSSSPTLQAQIEKYHSFFASYVGNGNVSQCLFKVDGSGASGGGSTALTSTLAAGALGSAASNRSKFVENLWGVSQQSGTYRYYQESVYILGLLATSGSYCYEF